MSACVYYVPCGMKRQPEQRLSPWRLAFIFSSKRFGASRQTIPSSSYWGGWRSRSIIASPPSGARRSVSVPVGHNQQRSSDDDIEVEQKRPVFNIIEVVFQPVQELVLGMGLASPAVDLPPAGDARLHAMRRALGRADPWHQAPPTPP